MAEHFDLVIIGGGPGGYAAAFYASAAGLSVALVERDKLGGTCLHRGCIPAKEFLETAAVFRNVRHAAEFGVQTGEPTIDFSVSQARKQKVVNGLWQGLQGLAKRRKVTVVAGTATLHHGNLVRVSDGSELKGTDIILAAGSVPRTLPGFEPDGQLVFTSDEFLDLTVMPTSAVVIGGGAIGCEFASVMADLGTKVTILEALPKILPGCDSDCVSVVQRSFGKRGIEIRTAVAVTGHAPDGKGQTTVHFGEGESVTVDAVVVSVGRRPRTEDLIADGAGVALNDRGFVAVDAYMRTSAPNVYAVGDVVPTAQLAHIGYAEAILAVKTILGEAAIPIAYDRVPWCIYSHPEVAFAGMNEEQARAAGLDVVVEKHRYAGNGRAQILGETDGLVKIIAERDARTGRAGRIVGVHMVGPWVTEQLGQAYLSVNWEATVDEVAQFIQPHPSLSETFGEAVLALTGRGLNG